MEARMMPKSGAAPTKPSTVVDVPPVQQPAPAGMVEPHTNSAHNHNKVVILDAARRCDLVGGVLTGAAFSDRVRRCFSVVGIAATSMAAIALAAGTHTPATGFALFVLLLGGLSLASLSVVAGGGASDHGCHGDDDGTPSLDQELYVMKV